MCCALCVKDGVDSTRHLGRRLGACVRLFRHHAAEEFDDRSRCGRIGYSRRLFMLVPVQNAEEIPAEGRFTGHELVQRHTQGVNVRTNVRRIAAALLGAHEVRCSQKRTRLRQAFARREGLGEPEIGNAYASLPVQQQVRRLHVPVDQTGAVRGIQSLGGLTDYAEGIGCGELSLTCDESADTAALHELHDKIRVAVLFPHIIDADDVAVFQLRGTARLTPEPFEERAIFLDQAGTQDLDRHVSVEFRLLCLEDHGHGAGADELEYAALAQERTDQSVFHRNPPHVHRTF